MEQAVGIEAGVVMVVVSWSAREWQLEDGFAWVKKMPEI
jgi:hypothetical protein